MNASITETPDGELARVQSIASQLAETAHAAVVLVANREGRLIVGAGALSRAETTALAVLAAGCVAASGAMAAELGHAAFASQSYEGQALSVYVEPVGDAWLLAVAFEARAALGLVRLRTRRAGDELRWLAADGGPSERVSPRASEWPHAAEETIRRVAS